MALDSRTSGRCRAFCATLHAAGAVGPGHPSRGHLCLVVDPTDARQPLQKRLCKQVRRIAAQGSPVPVVAIEFGDSVLIQRDTLGVLVHAAVDRNGARPVVILGISPCRATVETSVLFGATPVAVALGRDDIVPEAALAAALDQVPPWRMHAAR